MKRLWIAFAAVILVSFAVLLWAGSQIYQQKPPIPSQVVSSDGTVVISEGEVMAGQNVWQAMGGMELGSIWGHGSYTAPDWTADWLHRECEFVLNDWSQSEYHQDFATLAPDRQAPLREKLVSVMRTNTYKESTVRSQFHLNVRARFKRMRSTTRSCSKMAILNIQSPQEQSRIRPGSTLLLPSFFGPRGLASTNRPGQDVTYTSNWPHEAFVNNVPTPGTIVWTGVSIILLLAGIGGMVWYHAMRKKEDGPETLPDKDPFLSAEITPSQRAVVKYFWVVSGLILVQILLGVITAHYGVEGNGFYGIPLAKWLPYSVTRTWHLQLGIFWIATAWLAAGLYIAPLLSGKELKGQVFGTNFLFIALLVVVLGSLAGEWMSVQNMLSGDLWFYFGHQGYEYIDLGRVWQLALCAGLVLWVYLVGRHVLIALKRNDHEKPILITFLISAIAIGGFYFAGLGSGQHTNLAVAEYWRWWVVHLWVEGFFEVFAAVVIAFLFARMGLIGQFNRPIPGCSVLDNDFLKPAESSALLHHLYFTGTPTAMCSHSAPTFSALEVVPLGSCGL
jgi:nitric oxide reductase subunit B